MFRPETIARWCVRFFGAFGVCLAVSSALAAEPIVLMVAGLDKHIYLPVRLAQALGYFRQQGLSVQLQSEPSGVHAEDVLLVGAAQGVIGAYDHTIDLQAKGKAVQAVALLTLAPGEALLTSARAGAQLSTTSQLKSRKVGVTGLGSSTHFLTLYLASLVDLKPGDFSSIPVGGGASFVRAINTGLIDAGMTTEPTVTRLLTRGEAAMLVDLRSPQATRKVLGGAYPFASLYMQTIWIQSHRDEVQKLVNALIRALRYIQAHSAEEIANQLGFGADDWPADKASFLQSLGESRDMYSPDGLMPDDGPATVLRVLSVVDRQVRGKTIDLSKTYTLEFARAAATVP
jgi:NitT/TauT family transport system substrate-binding protein